MHDFLESTEQLAGEVWVDGEKKCDCRYELSFNPYDTNSMRIVLFDPPVDLPFGPDRASLEVRTDFAWGTYRLEVNSELAGVGWGGKGSAYRAPIENFASEQGYHPELSPRSFHISYVFPITSVTDLFSGGVQHWEYGLVRGEYDRTDNVIRPEDASFSIHAQENEITLGDEFDFHDGSSRIYPDTRIIRRSFAAHEGDIEGGEDLKRRINKVDSLIAKVFQVISLVERNRIGWHTKRLSTYSVDNTLISRSLERRWVSPPSSRYRPNPNARLSRRSTLRDFFGAYVTANDDGSSIIDRCIENFKIANTAESLQSSFIHWHSCLDFFRKIHLESSTSFSKDLVRMFDAQGIPLDDLLDSSTVQELRDAIKQGKRKAPAFDFTDLRNAYIHDGFEVFEGRAREASEMIRTMRALAERLLVKKAGLNPSETSLGDSSLD